MKNGATGNHYTASKMLEKLLKPGSVSLLASSFALFRIWEVIQDSEPRPRPGTPQVTPGAFELPRRSPWGGWARWPPNGRCDIRYCSCQANFTPPGRRRWLRFFTDFVMSRQVCDKGLVCYSGFLFPNCLKTHFLQPTYPHLSTEEAAWPHRSMWAFS